MELLWDIWNRAAEAAGLVFNVIDMAYKKFRCLFKILLVNALGNYPATTEMNETDDNIGVTPNTDSIKSIIVHFVHFGCILSCFIA